MLQASLNVIILIVSRNHPAIKQNQNENMKTLFESSKTENFVLISRSGEVLAMIQAYSCEHAVEVLGERVGTATRRTSDCIMSLSEYRATR